MQVSGARVSSAVVNGDVVPGTLLQGRPQSVLVGALVDLGLRPGQVLGLDVRPPAATGTPGQRGRATAAVAGPSEVVVEVAPSPPGQGQVLLVDDGGAVSWVLPDRPADGPRSRAAAVTRFRVPVALPLDGGVPGERGLVGKAARRLLRVLTFDLLDKVAGEVGDFFVTRWEAEKRQHRVRSFAAADYRNPAVTPLDAASLRLLSEGPALLMIHGTNSLTHSGFGALPPDEVAALNTRYGNRVFAFDHPTLSVDPLANCKALAGILADDLSLEVDVLAHSRGGLVARVLAELADAAGTAGKLKVRQIVLVATPNLGTPMADVEHYGQLLDGLTNLLDLVPDNPVTDSLAGIVAVVRQLAVGAVKGLDGLMSMSPRLSDNSFLSMLNSPRAHGTRYRAVAADYEPPRGSPKARWLRDAAIDALFGWEPNDLIVPTASAYAWNGAQNFPVTERVVLSSERAVDHSTYWTAPEALDAFRTWLSADVSALQAKPPIGPVNLARPVDDPLSEVDERFAAGDIEGVRQAVRALPPAELAKLESQVGDLSLDSFVSRGLKEPKAGVVFVLPGIMGSDLSAVEGGGDTDRIWLNPLRLMKGDFRRLRVNGGGNIKVGGLYRGYLPLIIGIDARWEVVPAGYDWRLSLEDAAESLAQRIRERSAGQPMPAHLVCHSMGGLVARMLIARHADVWRDIDSPDDRNKGGRLIMLGTPNLGSFAITLALSGDDHLVQWLARIDVRNDRDEIVRVLGSFPGAYQLLTSLDVEISDSDHKQLYDAGPWGSDAIVAGHLDAAREGHRVLARSGLDPDRMLYVAGSGHATPAAVKLDPDRPGRFRYRMTHAGDGRVTHQLGIPVDAGGAPVFGDRVWYSNAEHGDLTKDGDVVKAVVDLLQTGTTARLSATAPAPERGAAVTEQRWLPAEQVEPPIEAQPAVAMGARSLRSMPGSRAQLRADAQAATDQAVQGWLGTSPPEAGVRPVLNLSVLHASLEYSSYPVMVGHYRGDVIAGAEGYLDRKLGRQLTARQIANRYPEELGQVVRVPVGGRPPGAIVVGLGEKGDLTPTALASAARDAALEHAFGWQADPCRVGDGNLGLSTCLMGSYGVAGLGLAASVAAIVEGVVLANVKLASLPGAEVRISCLELVERYAGSAEAAAHVVRDIEAQLPGALLGSVALRPDQCLHQGEGRRPAVRTADYAAGQWHRIVVEGGAVDADGRMKLKFTSFGSRARADQQEQDVDTVLLGRMLEDAVVRPTFNPDTNTAMFEMLFPNDVRRELAGVDNIHLVVDAATADFPWEALSDRGGLTGGGPVALRGGFLRQLSSGVRRQLEPLTGLPRALVIGNPPGLPLFQPLEGARREAQAVKDLLGEENRLTVESLIYSTDPDPSVDSASQVVSALLGRDYQIVHIAGHGHFQQRGSRPPLGGVVIGPGAFLTAATLRSMRRPPDVVFLNCCHLGSVGAGNIDDSEVSQAFTRKRLNALAASLSLELTAMGVRAVVVAGWAVSDNPAAEFACTFYRELLRGAAFGQAVQKARADAYAADGGSSNTWAAYQCYGDPSFRLNDDGGDSTALPAPVSADEMQRRLEELEVAARDADDAYRQELSGQVRDQYEQAEREWPEKSRMWTAFGWAHSTLGETQEAIAAYRRALDCQDAMSPLKAVEDLADLEHRLSFDLTREGIVNADQLAPPSTPARLRRTAWQRLDSLDRLSRSSGRHALRARCHEREAVLRSGKDDRVGRTRELSAAAAEYVEAWQLSGDEPRRRDQCLAIRAVQLVSLGAELPVDVLNDLTSCLDAWRSSQAGDDFSARVDMVDLDLARSLHDIGQGLVRPDVAAAYQEVFGEGSAPDDRARVVDRIAVLATLVDGPAGRTALARLVDDLTGWSPCC